MKYLALFFVLSYATTYASSQELKNLITCHEALDNKAETHTSKLSVSSATPFVFQDKKNVYFVTDKSVGKLQNKFANSEIVVKLDEENQPFYSRIAFDKAGKIGTISFEVSPADKKRAVEPSAQLDDATLDLLKKELAYQISTVRSQYQNKYDIAGTLESLHKCEGVNSPTVKKNLAKEISYFEGLKPKSNYSNPASKSKQ